MKGLLKGMGLKFWMVLVASVSVALLILAIYAHSQARGIATAAGNTFGAAVGTAVGSFDGLFNGLREGAEAGAEAGLSAEDTQVNIQDSMKGIGSLDVLAAGVTVRNVNTIGEEYARLSLINGDAVFSVDMTQAEISFSQDGKEVYIVIPEPTMALYLDQSGTETLAEIQKFSFSVTAKDGLIDYLNSMAKTAAKAKEGLENYDSLMAQARESAQKRVQQLAEMLCGDRYVVQTRFR